MKTADRPRQMRIHSSCSTVARSLMKSSPFSCRKRTVLSTVMEGITFPLWSDCTYLSGQSKITLQLIFLIRLISARRCTSWTD